MSNNVVMASHVWVGSRIMWYLPAMCGVDKWDQWILAYSFKCDNIMPCIFAFLKRER